MTTFRLLHLRRFFEHRLRTVLTLLGIAIGSALAVAVFGLFGSMDGSVKGFTEDLAGLADIEVTGISNEGFDQKLFFQIEDTSGVQAAVPLIRTPVEVEGRRAVLIGIDGRAQALRTNLAESETQRSEVRATEPGLFLGEGLASAIQVQKGGTVRVFSAAGQSERLKVLSIVTGEAATLNQGMFAVTALPIAQNVVGKTGRLDSILVLVDVKADPAAVAARLVAVAGSLASVDSPTQRIEQAQLATKQVRQAMLMGVAMAITVGGFLIFITMNMAATERRRELATLRALGGRRGRLLFMFLLEAAALGLIGSLAGALLGLLLARSLVDSIPPFFGEATGVELGFYMPSYAIPMAIAFGALASVLAALLPARRAVGVAPVESMRPEGVLESLDATDRIAVVPSAIGILMMAGGFALAVVGPPAEGFLGLGLVLLGIIVASYGLTAPLTRSIARVARMLGVAGRLGAAALERSPRRAWATSAAVLLATGLVAGQGGIFDNLDDAVLKNLGGLGTVDLYVSVPGSASGLSTEVQLPGDWGDDLAAVDGVAEVGTNTFMFITYQQQKVLVQGLSGESMGDAAPATVGASPETLETVKDTKGAIVSERFRDLYGIDKGDELELATPTGIRRVDVVHVAPSFAWERGLITLGRAALVDWFGHTTVSDYGLRFEEGADPERIKSEVTKFVGGAPLEVIVYTGSESLEFIRASIDQINSLFRGLTTVVVGAAVLAILNALLISVVERKRELGIMRALGTGRRQLRRMVGLEAASIGVVGGLVGAVIGFLVHRTALASINAQTGFPIEYQFVAQPAARAFAIGVVIAVFGSLLPARRAGSVNIIEAIGYE